MSLKIQPASPEEHAFAAKVNKSLAGVGAAVHAFSMFNTETGAIQDYRLTFQCGAKRKTIMADGPFHHDPPEDVVKRVREWIAGNGATDRWSTDPKYAEG